MILAHGGYPMKIICAWCQRILDHGQPGDQVSHGCCRECMIRQFPELIVRHTKERTRRVMAEAERWECGGEGGGA
jgi:hypothetical protein